MSSGQPDASVAGWTAEPLSPLYKTISVISLFLAAVCAAPAVFYSYLNLNPPEPRDGDTYFVDGTRFGLGGVAV